MAKKWYVLHTYSGYEIKVKTNLESRIETMGLENNVFAIEIPKPAQLMLVDCRPPDWVAVVVWFIRFSEDSGRAGACR